MKYFSVKAYDGTIVRVEESKLEHFTIQQEKIKKMQLLLMMYLHLKNQ